MRISWTFIKDLTDYDDLYTARVTVLQEHQHQVDEALAAYDEALETGDPTQLGDNVLRPIAPVASDSDFLPSPSSDRSRVNGAASASSFNVMRNRIKVLLYPWILSFIFLFLFFFSLL